MVTALRRSNEPGTGILILIAVAIMITVLAINLLGDGIRDALDPGLRFKDD